MDEGEASRRKDQRGRRWQTVRASEAIVKNLALY